MVWNDFARSCALMRQVCALRKRSPARVVRLGTALDIVTEGPLTANGRHLCAVIFFLCAVSCPYLGVENGLRVLNSLRGTTTQSRGACHGAASVNKEGLSLRANGGCRNPPDPAHFPPLLRQINARGRSRRICSRANRRPSRDRPFSNLPVCLVNTLLPLSRTLVSLQGSFIASPIGLKSRSRRAHLTAASAAWEDANLRRIFAVSRFAARAALSSPPFDKCWPNPGLRLAPCFLVFFPERTGFLSRAFVFCVK